jgi:hypothetical protein
MQMRRWQQVPTHVPNHGRRDINLELCFPSGPRKEIHMPRWASNAFVCVSLFGIAHASADELVGSTRCADYVRMQTADTQPGADQAVALKHVKSLMHEYSKYILRGPDGKPIPTVFNFIISYSTHYCQAHPTETVAEAGEAIGAAEQQAIANSRQR